MAEVISRAAALRTELLGLDNADARLREVQDEINAAAGSSVIASVARKIRTSDLPQFYTGFSGTNFTLVPGEAYTIVVTSGVAFSPSHY